MPVQYFFPVATYWSMIDNEAAKKEAYDVYLDLKAKKAFKKNEAWQSHKLSDTTFKQNVITEYNMTNFNDEIHKHLTYYLNEMQARFDRAVDYSIASCWLTTTSKGEYAHIHTHKADISGVYYIKTNQKDGKFFFTNPNTPALMNWYADNDKTIEYTPEEGKLLLFPSWLAHGVWTNTTNNERVSMSFDIIFKR